MNWYLTALKKGLTFRGRARRKEYWYFLLFNLIISLILSLFDGFFGWYDVDGGVGVLSGIYSFLMILPVVAVSVRRIHDSDHSGWWAILLLLPIIGYLILLYFFVKQGTLGENQYGANPLENHYESQSF